MVGFRDYRSLAQKRGPDPYWTPVVPLHRAVSFPLSWLYANLGVKPLSITFLGLALVLAGGGLILWQPHWGPALWVGLAALKLGVVHDYCDGEVARYRIAKGLQSPRTHRVGIFADIWVYTVLVQGLMPTLLGAYAWRMGQSPLWLAAGFAATLTLVSSYVVAFGQAAYWPERAPDLTKASPSHATGATGLLASLQKAYFQLFETAVFTTHLALALAVWAWQTRPSLDAANAAAAPAVPSNPPWALGYAAACIAALGLAFVIAHVRTLRGFDRHPGEGP